MKALSFILILAAMIAQPAFAALEPQKDCSSDQPETVPAKVNIVQVLKDISALKDTEGRVIVDRMDEKFRAQLAKLFEGDQKSISKLEQFYGLLFYLALHRTLRDKNISFEPKSVTKLLISSKVFSDPKIPGHISAVTLAFDSQKEKASYDVKFDRPEVRFALNNGKGFSNFREGLCQTARELIFYGGFQFDVHLTINNGHVFVSNFKNVDLFGTFGARGIVDVDIQYVSLRSVEFLSGSAMGVVRAKVSKKEFEVNDHSILLQMVSSMVTDKSTQAIDW